MSTDDDLVKLAHECGAYTTHDNPGQAITFYRSDLRAFAARLRATPTDAAPPVLPPNYEQIIGKAKACGAVVTQHEIGFTHAEFELFIRSSITPPPLAATQGPSKPVALPFAIIADELEALHRFYDTTEDEQDYDVPLPMMKKLATIGLVRRVTGNRYKFTDFGLSVRNGDFSTPPPLAATQGERSQIDALDAARYRFMRQNIDYTEDPEDGSGFYWHNQRGEFSYFISGGKRPTFEEVIDAAIAGTPADAKEG
jgi:hypothetical protein